MVTLTATEVPTTSFQLMLRGLGSGQYTPDQSDIIYSVITKQEPYVERVGIDGLAKMELVGGTVAWNQLVQNGNFETTNGWSADGSSSFSVTDNVASFVAINTGQYNLTLVKQKQTINGHKVIIRCAVNATVASKARFRRPAISSEMLFPANTWVTLTTVLEVNTTGNNNNYIGVQFDGVEGKTFNVKDFYLTDLTQMFGTAIADYVYSLEQAVAGSGIAWLKSYGFFTKDYYEYDAGSLQSVCTSARKITDSSGNERTYPIDDIQLRGLFKLDTNNKLYCDGDVYKSNGAVTRKYGIVDLGTLNWGYVTSDGGWFNAQMPSNAASHSLQSIGRANNICTKYPVMTGTFAQFVSSDKTILVSSSSVSATKNLAAVRDTAYTDAASFKTAMSGVYLVYELATETTETADPYINPQRSIENGTEEFVDGLTRDVMVPVGNVTQYYQSEIIPIISEYIDAVMASN
jgi:hypothetical protein